MTSSRAPLFAWLAGVALVLAACLACIDRPVATPTPDYAALETQVLAKLAATLTAKEPPTATQTPTAVPETATPAPTVTPTMTPTAGRTLMPGNAIVAYARTGQDGAMNIVLQNLAEEAMLTHFAEARHVRDLTWSRDGEWLVFVSAHDYMLSSRNEYNVWAVHPDGTGLHMITGDYRDPAAAPGPYVTLKGQVAGGQGACRVCAQGASSVVTAAEDGSYELPGVPVTAAWARAVCQAGDVILQGMVGLALSENAEAAVPIEVQASGQGWSQVSLSRDNRLLAGIFYLWAVDDQGEKHFTSQGMLYDWSAGAQGVLEVPAGTTLMGVDWSPVADELVGALVGDKSTWLWRWSAEGKSLGALFELPNSDRYIYAAANPVWSPDGNYVAFELREWDWWEGSQRKTELLLYHVGDEQAQPLVTPDWGADALNPSWASSGQFLYYQLTAGAPEQKVDEKDNGTLCWVTLQGESAQVLWAAPLLSYLPAAHPLRSEYLLGGRPTPVLTP